MIYNCLQQWRVINQSCIIKRAGIEREKGMGIRRDRGETGDREGDPEGRETEKR
jgi:hypothetical protein